MSYQDELRNLRWELEQLLRKGESLSSRLEALEARALKEGAKAESATPPAGTSLPAAPPPLPSIVAEAPAVGLAPSPGREPEPAMLSDVLEQAPPQPKLAPLPLGPSLSEQIAKVLKKLGPKEEMNWEMALWTWWMPRIAIVVLVIGVVGGMAYAIEQLGNAWWIPYFRLAMGYSTCAALLVLGKYLEHRFTNYARVLLSGGIALSYFVTFATHYVRFTRVFVYPEPTLVLLGLIVVIWGTVAQYRKSVLVACAVTALGHLTVALSTLTLEPPSRFAVVGLLALSVVSAFYLAWNRWYKVAAIGMVGSYLNHFFWLAESPPSDAVIDFIVAMSVLAVYFLIFALAEYVAPAELRRRAVSFRLRSAYASFNSAAFFVLGYSIMRGFDFARDYTYVFYFALAAVLAVFAFSYWLRRAADPLHNLYFTKAASVATLGFATYFDGAILTATLAVEAVVLLMGARRSGLVVSRLLAHAVAVLAFFHGLYVVFEMPWPATYGDPAFAGMTTSSAVAVLALLVGALLYQRTDWSTRGVGVGTRTDTDGGGEGLVEWLARRPNLHALLWQHDLVVTAPREGLNKPLEGLLYPYSYTFGAAILGVLFTNRLLEQVHTAPALGLLALTLTVAGVLLSNKPYTSGALIWAVFGAFAWLLAVFVEIPADALKYRDHMYDAPRYAEYLVSGVFALLPLLLLAELVRLARPQDTTLWLRGRHADDPTPLPDIYALSAFLVLLTGVIVLAEPGHRLLALAMAAAAFGGYALVVPAPAIGTLPFLASVSSAVFFTGEVVDGLPALTFGAALVLLAGAAVLSEQRYLADRHGLRRLQDLAPPYFLYGVVAWLFGVYAVFTWDSPPDVLALLCGGVVLVAVSAVLNPGACGAWSVFLLAWAYAHWTHASAAASPVLWHGAVLGIIAAALAGERWLHLQAPQVRVQRWGMHFVAWAAALSYLHDAVPPQWHLALWGLSAFAWLAWAGATRPLSALVFGLLAAILTTFALLAESYGDALRTGPLIAGYSVVILFWLGIERLQAWSAGLERTPQWLREQYWRSILVSLPCVLLVLMLERIPLLASYYLTISWTAAALAAFGVALATRERWYRYAGLGVFLLALGRVFLVDLRELQPIFRVLAFIVLGAVLLAVAYGYLLARQRMRESVESTRS